MELLIPGLILVALMVYASTRIKKSAAAAFDAETVETDEFIISKPEGFLNVLNGDPKYAFEAYSREFGSDEASGFRRATANLTIHENATVDEVAAVILLGDVEAASDIWEVIGERRYRLIEVTRLEKGIELRDLYKIAESSGNVYEFKITMIAETTGDVERNIEVMLNSFELK